MVYVYQDLLQRDLTVHFYEKRNEIWVRVSNQDRSVFNSPIANFEKETIQFLCGAVGIHPRQLETWVEIAAARAQQIKREKEKKNETDENGRMGKEKQRVEQSERSKRT